MPPSRLPHWCLSLVFAVPGCADELPTSGTPLTGTETSPPDDDDSPSDPSVGEDDDSDPSGNSDDPTNETIDPSTSAATTSSETADPTTGGPTGGPAGTCGTGGGTGGEILQIELGSPDRWYLIGAPDTDEPLPLVVAFHGDEGDPFNSTRFIWGSYWEQNDLPFIAVMTKCPGCTSWYQGDTSANADYVWEVLADVATDHNVDVSRIYAVGYSGGSEFLSIHGWEFQDVFAGIQFSCGGNAYSAYTPPSRPDCKVAGRIVIAADDFLWNGAQMLLARLETEGHPHEFVEAQCSGHCCDTPDRNEGAWAWFQTVTKCDGIVPGTCGELEDLPPVPNVGELGWGVGASGSAVAPEISIARAAKSPRPDFAGARDRLDAVLPELERATQATPATEREALFREAMAAYDAMLAAAHVEGPHAKAELQSRYPRLRAAMAKLRVF